MGKKRWWTDEKNAELDGFILQGFTAPEIAKMMGKSAGTIRDQARKIRRPFTRPKNWSSSHLIREI